MSDPKTLCVLAGFDPEDAKVWSWWVGLTDKDRRYLAYAMDRAKMTTLTDSGVHVNQIHARPRR